MEKLMSNLKNQILEANRMEVSLEKSLKVDQVKRRNYNSFAPLQEGNLECFRCHNYGHKSSNFILMGVSDKPKFIREQKKLWKEKKHQNRNVLLP
jgi:hypothetical protein